MYRLLTIFALSLALLAACSDEIFTPDFNAMPGEAAVGRNGIPVVSIKTDDGKDVTDKKTWKSAEISINGCNIFDNLPSTPIMIKGRGNSSFRFAKKPFNIAFEEKTKLLGMKKAKKWVFLANYRDPTLLRNDLTLRIGQLADGLEWTPHGEFVDLVCNGKYAGNYFVCEKININKQHVNIDEMTADDTAGEALTGGYLLQFDNTYDEQNKFKTEVCNLPVGILSPNEDTCQPEQVEYIKDFLHQVEMLMKTGNYTKLYDEYLDINSFVDYFLIQTFTGNNDFAAPRSVYVYKKRNGKLFAGPLWDFDFSTYYKDTTGIRRDAWWYKYLFRDAAFRSCVKERWAALAPRIEAEAFDYLEHQKNYIFLSMIENFKVFPYDYSLNHHILMDSGFLMGYNEMIRVMHERIAYMNEYFANL